ncbi:MAG: hemerythrin family protein [Magnetospirillum sp.]|nr:hemerythrin family protein [Magnetospirillum sp.]
MAWKDSLSVDVVSIDQEHRQLGASIEELFAHLRNGASREQALNGLDRLIEAVAQHFDHEERIMRNIALPSLAVHHQLHQGLLEEIGDFRAEIADGSNERPTDAIETFLHGWLYRHIAAEDHKIKEHLNRD